MQLIQSATAIAAMVAIAGCTTAPSSSPATAAHPPRFGGDLSAPLDMTARSGEWYIAAIAPEEISRARIETVRWAILGKDVRQETIYLAQLNAVQRDQEQGEPAQSAAAGTGVTSAPDLVIRFATGKAGPMPPPSMYTTELSRIRQAPVVLVSGHTDSVGSDAANQRLSQARVNAVRDWLVSQGISGAQIHTQALGERHPAHRNDTPKGRALNRRVEIAR